MKLGYVIVYTPDVVAAVEFYERAFGLKRRFVAEGATEVAAPERKPWGQTVSYVRDRDGVLVELCSPMG